MKRKEIAEFLYRFYRKRVASFMANIYKASITGSSRDIHHARLDFKKVFALYDLFEILQPGAITHLQLNKSLTALFKYSGKIREIQVNYLLLSGSGFQVAEIKSLMTYFQKEELLATKNFLRAIRKFNETDLETSGKVVRKFCRSNPPSNLSGKTSQFIRRHALAIGKLRSGELSDQKVHKIRQHIKSMSTIATLVCLISKSKKLDSLVSQLNRTEIMIGNWHDRIVLKTAIDKYLERAKGIPDDEAVSLREFRNGLTGENQELLLALIPDVDVILQSILRSSGLVN